MTSTLAILGRFSGDKAKALAYCDDLIETYTQCREDIAAIRAGTEDDSAPWNERRASVTDADYRWQ